MKVWLTAVPHESKIEGIKALRNVLALPLKVAKDIYDAVDQTQEAAQVYEGEQAQQVHSRLVAEGFGAKIADERPELSQPASEAPAELPVETFRTLAILMQATDGNLMKAAMFIKQMQRTHDSDYWEQVFLALTETYNVVMDFGQ